MATESELLLQHQQLCYHAVIIKEFPGRTTEKATDRDSGDRKPITDAYSESKQIRV